MKASLFARVVSLATALLAVLIPAAEGQVVISEFMAGNASGVTDEDGGHPDWIELHNSGNAAVNLAGWSLTDSETHLTLWRLPSVTIGANGYILVFASAKDRAVAGAELHANFSLSVDGEYLALVRPGGAVVESEFAPAFPPQANDVSFGLFQGRFQYFPQPTPGAANTAGLDGLVADAKFSHDRGFYDAPFEVVIRTETPEAAVFYTLDGTEPSATNGVAYTGPIQVSGTTVLRAAAFKPSFVPSKADTQTYLFLDDVIRQSPDGKAPPGWPSSWGGNTVDYGMDPDVVNSPRYRNTIKDDLRSISSISLVMNLNDLFGSRGIYSNPSQDGVNWERPCSVELIDPGEAEGFQINAGVRIRGGYSRSTGNPKHAFRLFFRGEYGDSKLAYPLFGEDGVEEFDAVDLRTFQNYSWSFEGDSRGVFIRDQFSRDAQLAMGRQGERGKYHHLYINGQYWGLFNTAERPEASYGASYFGGETEDYDVIKVAPDSGYTIYATDGDLAAWTRLWNAARAGLSSDAAYQRIQGNNPDGTPNPEYEVLLDVGNMIDYMLVILYGGNLDAPISNFLGNSSPNNFFALRNRTARQGFQFIAHDSEHTLLDVNQNRMGPYSAGSTLAKSNPQWIWQQCWNNPEFRMRVADHAQRHFFNGGALSPEGAANLFRKRTNEIHRAVVGESARWGDSKRGAPRTRDVEWLSEANRILNNYMPQRTGIVLNQLRARSLFPNLAAPEFSQFGGNVDKGYQLSVTAAEGTIYYTINGTDPRLAGGAKSPSATAYTEPIALVESVSVKARTLSGTTWSALTEADFIVIQTFTELLVTELMYNPATEASLDGEQFEFLELKNVGPVELDLSGVRITDGVAFTFPNGTKLAPAHFAVLVSDPTAFTARYPGVPISGVYTGQLGNSGERVTVAHAVGTPIFSVSYSDSPPWPISADGQGFSLVPVNANLNPDPVNPASWRASSRVEGSPGADDTPVNIQPVWINEVLTRTDPPDLDQVELFNPGPAGADISHWFLSDSLGEPRKFRIPAGTILPPGGYRLFTEQQFNSNPAEDGSFRLDALGEEIYLHSADPAGGLTGFSDGFAFGAAANGVTFGRYLTSVGQIHYPAQRARTLGAENAGPLIGPVVINEIEYHPSPLSEEFIELKNTSPNAVKLFDPEHPTNTWRIHGVDFQFPAGSEIPPSGLAVLVANDPDVFRSRFAVPAGVPVFGPFTGALQDNGEALRLERPDAPDLDGNGEPIVPFIVVDAVRFNDKAPWPPDAAGLGSSLERVDANAYGDDPVNWRASLASPSPGFENDANRVPRIHAGADRSLQATSFPTLTNLTGTASDDGQPNPPGALNFTWSQVSGPGPVTFLSPGQLASSASFPGYGTYILRLTADDGELQASDEIAVMIERTPSEVTLIPAGAIWKYLDDGSNQGALWRTPDFDDRSWASGAAELGYGDSSEGRPEKTVIGFGPSSSNKHITYYFRHTFNIASAAAVKQLTVALLRDDGAVVYLNGIEVFRSNLPLGDIGSTTLANNAVGSGDEAVYYESSVNPSALRDGENVVAVEIHQVNVTSTDLSFDLVLSGLAVPENQPPVVNAGADFSLALTSEAALQGSALDDGLPAPPGQLTIAWSMISGPGEVRFANPASAVTTARFTVPGTHTLRLAATDGALSAEDDVVVTVTGESFDDWKISYFSPAELADPAICGEAADPDQDGHSNREEFGAGTDPTDSQSVLKASLADWSGPTNVSVTLSFQAMPNKSYTVQFRDDVRAPWIKLADVEPQPAVATVDVKDLEPSEFGPRFYRIVTPRQPN